MKTCECLGYRGIISCGVEVTALDPVECLKPAIELRQATFLASTVLRGNEEAANFRPKLLAGHVACNSASPAPGARTDREGAATGPHLPDDMMSAMLDASGMTEITQAKRSTTLRQEGLKLPPQCATAPGRQGPRAVGNDSMMACHAAIRSIR